MNLRQVRILGGDDNDLNEVTYDFGGNELLVNDAIGPGISVATNGAPTRFRLTHGGYTVASSVEVTGVTPSSASLIVGPDSTLSLTELTVSGGAVTVDDARLIQTGGALFVGDGGGSGSLTITNNSAFTSDFIAIMGGAGNEADILVESGSDWTSSQLRLGEDLGSTGRMTVDGAGATMVADFGCFVGYNGAGEFEVTGGASVRFIPDGVTTGTGFLGLARIGATSSGTMVADGVGTVVSVEGPSANALAVGRDGQGSLTVSNGALVTTVAGGDVAIGRTATASGTALVTGAGAILRGHNGISVGGTQTAAGNIGSLSVTNGGSIQTTNLVVYGGDTVTVNTGGFGTIGAIGAVVNTANTLTVRTGGTLRGVGTITGNVANVTGGTLAPGAPGSDIGKLTINGALNNGNCVVGAGGTLTAQINAAGTAGVNYDTVQVSGDVLLGGTLNLVVAGSYVPNGANQFNIITGSDNIVGAFESITNRVITAGVGGRVWGDYKENNASPGADRYYVSPRRQADFNGTGGVSGADYTIWADNFGKQWATFGEGDANGDHVIGSADFTVWADNYGQASLGVDLLPVSTYGYGVDELVADSAPTLAEVNDIALMAAGDREILSGYGGFNGSANPVPEPSTVLLGGLALAGLAGYALRRRSA